MIQIGELKPLVKKNAHGFSLLFYNTFLTSEMREVFQNHIFRPSMFSAYKEFAFG